MCIRIPRGPRSGLQVARSNITCRTLLPEEMGPAGPEEKTDRRPRERTGGMGGERGTRDQGTRGTGREWWEGRRAKQSEKWKSKHALTRELFAREGGTERLLSREPALRAQSGLKAVDAMARCLPSMLHRWRPRWSLCSGAGVRPK